MLHLLSFKLSYMLLSALKVLSGVLGSSSCLKHAVNQPISKGTVPVPLLHQSRSQSMYDQRSTLLKEIDGI
ncbi:hypothetical protein GGR54DRAFT_603125 [Hypoxylon sp. NC1633]|nr:hypothetical protein GGR54DRAFT_603125 [Hypoxylon sp. NC1633]